jgi:dipeptidyl aminopeptidase/acylaminoacyl peptidase
MSGWGHLYLIDLTTGAMSRAVTAGDWAIFDVIAVAADAVFFTAGGRESGRHPYYRHLYRADLDGDEPNTGLRLLTPEDADHGFPGEPTPHFAAALGAGRLRSPISPSGRYFVDCFSTVECAPVTVIRDSDGMLVAELVRGDISRLEAVGWRAPEIVRGKAADGETELFGVLIKPRDFDEGRAWPVVERIYGGPQIIAQPRSFAEGLNGAFTYGLNSLADMGFVVAIIDGPGTPNRSRAFRDMTWGKADRWGLAHHRAALEGIAASRPWLDLSRVGVAGHSFGGYAVAMAMLLEPDFYKAGVSSAGMFDPMWAYQRACERYLGAPDFGGGRRIKQDPAERAINYAPYAPSAYAANLAGELLLICADLDENIQPAGLFDFANALIRAGKSFDQLVLPGRNHGFASDPYVHKRTWDYFVEHLQQRRPLKHHRLDVTAGTRLIL